MHDLPRVMRLPGFLHRKTASPFLTHIVDGIGTTAPPYTLAEIVGTLHLDLDAADDRARARVPPGASIAEGARNAHLFAFGRMMAKKGLTREAVEAALHAENTARCDPPLEDERVRYVAERAFTAKDAAGWQDRPRERTQHGGPSEIPPAVDKAPAAESTPSWPKPMNLFRGLAAPPLTIADVPSVLGDYPDQFARAGGFDPTGALVASVVTCAGVIDDGIRLLLPGASGHFQSARLWVAAIGSPGAGKSPMQKTMLAPIYAIHRSLIAANESEREAGKEPQDRTPRRALFTSDCTIDKLSELLADNPRGLLYCVDEFDSWLGQHEAFGRDAGARNRGEWMRLYDGGPHQVDRVKRGSFYVKNWGASVLTATTPAALVRLSRKLSADGLFQRFLVFTIAPMQDRDRNILHVTVDAAQHAYDDRIRAIFAHSVALIEHPTVRLSGDAATLYEAEERRLRLLVESAEAIGEGFAAHIAKHAGMLARVALTFHAASDDLLTDDGLPRHPCTGNVSAQTMRLASRFMRRAYQHSFAIYTKCFGIGSPMDLAKAMARSLLADRMASFNRREITHRCKAFRGATEWQRTAALTTLQDFGWIEGDTFLPQHGGRWTVNPRVHDEFANEAVTARERRKQVLDALKGETP